VEIAHFTAIFTAYRIFAYIPTLLIIIRLGRYARRSQGLQRRQALWMLGALSVAFLAGVPTIFTATATGLNPTPIGMAIFAITFAWAFQKRLFAIMPVAYETVLRNMRDGVLVLNQEDVVVDMNPAARTLFPQANIIGQPIQALLTDESFLQAYRALRRNAGIDLQAKAGDEQHTYEISISPITAPQGDTHGRVIVLHDIEYRQQAEESLRESEARLRLITTSMADIVMQSDLTGNLIYMSPSVEGLLGYSADHWLNLHAEERIAAIHPDDQMSIVLAFQKCISTGESGRVEYRQQTRRGHYVWVESNIERAESPSGEGASLIISTRDISGRKQMEETLRKNAEDSRHFRDRLQDLHRLNLELSEIDHWDTLTRHIVERGRELLQIDRLALFALDPTSGVFVGSFGTDRQGNTTDERQYRADFWKGQVDQLNILDRGLLYREDVDLYFNDQVVGQGWHAVAFMASDTHPAGLISADNLITGRPLTPDDREIFRLFAALTGSALVRQRTLDTLRTSEERYRIISELISDYAYSYRVSPDGTMSTEWVTESYTRLTGYAIGEIDHRGTYTLYHPTDQARVEADVKAVVRGEETAGDYRIITKQGEERWLHISRYPVWDHTKNQVIRFYGVAKDITQRKKDEVTLRESEERYRSTITAIQEGLVVNDASGIQFCNKSAEQIIGLTIEQMLGRGTSSPEWRTIHEDGSPFPMELQPAAIVMRTGEPQTNVVIGMYRPDGTLVWILVHAQPLFKDGQTKPYGVVSTITDITTRKQIEDNLRQSEEKYRLIAENTSDGIIIWNAATDRITYASPAYDALLGLEAGATAGWTNTQIMELFHPDDRGAVKELFKQAIRQQAKSLALAYRVQHRDGHYLWKEDLFTFNYAPDHSLVDTYVISRDITERKLAETRQMELMLEKERTGILTYFIEKASHEFRTPLAIINSAASFMVRLEDTERKKLKAETVEQQVMRITKLVNMLLMMTRLESKSAVERVPVDVNRMIRHECQSVVKKYGSAIRLEQQIPGILPMLPGDLNDLSDAFQQVLDNAFRYTPSEGVITVLAGTEADHLWLEVRDTGAGISPEAMPHIFETFWREDKPHTTPGFGLGLPIAQRVVHMHGGTIHVESVVGQGTTVRMTFPLNSPDKTA
jgi:PAS domain S-box-containing protein